MYLLETNIFLEILLDQEKADEVENLLRVASPDMLFLSEFSLYSIGIVLFRQKMHVIFLQLVDDLITRGGCRLIRLDIRDLPAVAPPPGISAWILMMLISMRLLKSTIWPSLAWMEILIGLAVEGKHLGKSFHRWGEPTRLQNFSLIAGVGGFMRLKFDPENDALYLRLDESSIVESEEVQPGVILDYDKQGNVIGVELLGLNKRVPRETLQSLQFETA